MEEAKKAEIKSFAIANSITDPRVLEHYYIFGSLDLSSYEQAPGAPRSEHYSINELRAIVDEIAGE